MPKPKESNATEVETFERRFPWPVLPVLVVVLLGAGATGLDGRELLFGDGPVPMFFSASIVVAALLIGSMIAVASMTQTWAGRVAVFVVPVVVFVLYGFSAYHVASSAGQLSAPPGRYGPAAVGDVARGESVAAWTIPLALVALFLFALVFAVLLRRPVDVDTDTDAEPERVDPEMIQHAGEVIVAGRVALREHVDDRAAVIACYAAMEDALRSRGVRRRVADTPSELLSHTESMGLFSPAGAAAAVVLVGLFERARFSTAPLPETARAEAESALIRLEQDLDALAAAGEARR